MDEALNRNELFRHLESQLELLDAHCATYDAGKPIVMLSAATAVRVLVHGEGAVLKQLGVLDQFPFQDGTLPLTREIVAARGFTPGLAVISFNGSGGPFEYTPLFRAGGEYTRVRFNVWWTRAIAMDQDVSFTRRDIVLGTANKDGGAHVDLKKRPYADLPRDGFANVSFRNGSSEAYNLSPLPAMMRQISEEVLHAGRLYLA